MTIRIGGCFICEHHSVQKNCHHEFHLGSDLQIQLLRTDPYLFFYAKFEFVSCNLTFLYKTFWIVDLCRGVAGKEKKPNFLQSTQDLITRQL
jgi:hypothetical protein